MSADHEPCSPAELIERFHRDGGTSKHLLLLYSLAIGLRAKTIVELGLGLSTGALRTAALETGGIVHTYDQDRRRYGSLLAQQDGNWRLTLETTAKVLPDAPAPIDLVLHDGAHDYVNVKRDLDTLLPKMRRFGIVCIHDTQQPDLYRDMLAAIADASAGRSVSVTNLPFNCGLAILRVEESDYPAISPTADRLIDGRCDTQPVPFILGSGEQPRASLWSRTLLPAKIRVGHFLRQRGLRR